MRTILRTTSRSMALALVEFADGGEGMELVVRRADIDRDTDDETFLVQAPETYDRQVCSALVRNFRQEWRAWA